MYDRTSEHQGVDAARRYLFSKTSREIENIPPTAAALLEHTKRAAFQAGHIWGQCLRSVERVVSAQSYESEVQTCKGLNRSHIGNR